MLTIFATFRPFVDRFAIVQENAIRSWLAIDPMPHVILYGHAAGTREMAESYHLEYVPDVKTTASGLVLMDHLFADVERRSRDPYLAFINGDILVFQELYDTIGQIHPHLPSWCGGVLRYESEQPETLPSILEPNWAVPVKAAATRRGHPHSGDCFLYTRGFWGAATPAFAVGMTAHDNWCYYYAHKQNALIELADVWAIHQAHPAGSDVAKREQHPDYARNRAIYRATVGPNWAKSVRGIGQSNWILRGGQLVRR